MGKRFYQNLGIALLVLPALVAAAIQLTIGGVVSTTPERIISQGSAGNAHYTVLMVGLSFHWAVLLMLVISFVAGLGCIVVASRRLR